MVQYGSGWGFLKKLFDKGKKVVNEIEALTEKDVDDLFDLIAREHPELWEETAYWSAHATVTVKSAHAQKILAVFGLTILKNLTVV